MSARQSRLLSDSALPVNVRVHTDSREETRNIELPSGIQAPNAPGRTLSPVSSNAMNSRDFTSDSPSAPKTPNGTIRSVPSEPLHLETASANEDSWRVQSRSDPSTLTHSSKTYPSISTLQPLLVRQNSISVTNGLVRSISSEFGPTKSYTNNNQQSSEESAASSGGNPLSPSTGSGGNQWSAAVGRANLGKSGRVIEKLMGENDKLKREINTEKTRAEDFRQAAKMIEGRMDAMAQEYDKKLHDAAINKAQLKKRERQLNEARALIDGEKAKAEKALEREQGWKAEMERIEEASKRKVEEAQTYAALMEGRNNAMTSHWKEQGAEVDRTVSKLGKEVDILVVERRKDDERMNTLQGLCDQQAEQLEDLQKEKQAIQDAFEAYKREQEEALKAIKDRARAQEAANERALQETHKVLGELKWALGVKANVKGAQ